MPLGLSATEDFLLKISSRVGRRARAKSFIAEESAAAVRDTRAHVSRLIAGRTAQIRLDDPALSARLRALCGELGLAIAEDPQAPRQGRVLYLAATISGRPKGAVHVPMGYPNYLEHPLTPRPALGYAGFRHLVDRVAAAVLRSEASGEFGTMR